MASDDASEIEEVRNLQLHIRKAHEELTITFQRLKSALWYQIGLYVDAKGAAEDFNATPQFIGALTELVYTQIGIPPSIPSAHLA
jgi:hypothetical protein